MKNYDPKYRFCPVQCDVGGYNDKRRAKCSECPVRLSEEKLEAAVTAAWQRTLGHQAYRFRFENVLAALYEAIGFEDLPKEALSVRAAQLLNCYIGERNYAQDKKDFRARSEGS